MRKTTRHKELNFNEHAQSQCKKVSQKINALSGVKSNMNFEQRQLIMNPLTITSHFSYCPAVWIFHSR